MSGIVHFKGKITEINPRQEKTLEQIATSIVNDRGFEVPDYYDTNLQYLTEEISKEFIIINEKFYKIEKEDVMWEENVKAEINEDGSINFDVKFHNGGKSIEDAIEKAINNLKQ